jgi:hypothetical protein
VWWLDFSSFKVLSDTEELVRPAGLEPAASGLEIPRSIRLSYGRILINAMVFKSNISKLCQ